MSAQLITYRRGFCSFGGLVSIPQVDMLMISRILIQILKKQGLQLEDLTQRKQ